MLTPERRTLPLKGHKHLMTRVAFETYCECGWVSCPHWERKHAYQEWRAHILSHGGGLETWEKAKARQERARSKALASLDTPA